MERIRCPFHEESTPSCVVYPDGFRCYGCGRSGKLSELGRAESLSPKERHKENLDEKLEYIRALPKKTIRGFSFHFDTGGYYLLWPSGDFYKKRRWTDEAPKYIGPAGHPKPAFWVRRETCPTVALCEGEFNALSLAEAFPEWDVCSPGSATDFKTDKSKHLLLTYCLQYARVYIITDRDGPGTEAAIHAKGLLIGKVPTVKILLLPVDANELLVEKGKEGLRREIEERLPEAL